MTAQQAAVLVDRATPLRQRIVESAAELTAESGWSSVTMSRLAVLVGISRQTVYNEIGSKPQLAEAMILSELGRFLSVVEGAFDDHPGDAVASVRAAVQGVLELAQGDAVLRAIVSSSQGGDTELLPLLTTQSGSLLTVARAVMTERLTPLVDPGHSRELETAVDVIVRVVLSHVMQPSATPAESAEAIAWTAGCLVRAR